MYLFIVLLFTQKTLVFVYVVKQVANSRKVEQAVKKRKTGGCIRNKYSGS